MGEVRLAFGMRRHHAALDEKLVIEGQGHRLAGGRGDLGRGVPGLDAGDLGGFAGGREGERIADLDAAAFDAAHDQTAMVEFEDVLHRQPQRQFGCRTGSFKSVEQVDHGLALVPGCLGRSG